MSEPVKPSPATPPPARPTHREPLGIPSTSERKKMEEASLKAMKDVREATRLAIESESKDTIITLKSKISPGIKSTEPEEPEPTLEGTHETREVGSEPAYSIAPLGTLITGKNEVAQLKLEESKEKQAQLQRQREVTAKAAKLMGELMPSALASTAQTRQIRAQAQREVQREALDALAEQVAQAQEELASQKEAHAADEREHFIEARLDPIIKGIMEGSYLDNPQSAVESLASDREKGILFECVEEQLKGSLTESPLPMEDIFQLATFLFALRPNNTEPKDPILTELYASVQPALATSNHAKGILLAEAIRTDIPFATIKERFQPYADQITGGEFLRGAQDRIDAIPREDLQILVPYARASLAGMLTAPSTVQDPTAIFRLSAFLSYFPGSLNSSTQNLLRTYLGRLSPDPQNAALLQALQSHIPFDPLTIELSEHLNAGNPQLLLTPATPTTIPIVQRWLQAQIKANPDNAQGIYLAALWLASAKELTPETSNPLYASLRTWILRRQADGKETPTTEKARHALMAALATKEGCLAGNLMQPIQALALLKGEGQNASTVVKETATMIREGKQTPELTEALRRAQIAILGGGTTESRDIAAILKSRFFLGGAGTAESLLLAITGESRVTFEADHFGATKKAEAFLTPYLSPCLDMSKKVEAIIARTSLRKDLPDETPIEDSTHLMSELTTLVTSLHALKDLKESDAVPLGDFKDIFSDQVAELTTAFLEKLLGITVPEGAKASFGKEVLTSWIETNTLPPAIQAALHRGGNLKAFGKLAYYYSAVSNLHPHFVKLAKPAALDEILNKDDVEVAATQLNAFIKLLQTNPELRGSGISEDQATWAKVLNDNITKGSPEHIWQGPGAGKTKLILLMIDFYRTTKNPAFHNKHIVLLGPRKINLEGMDSRQLLQHSQEKGTPQNGLVPTSSTSKVVEIPVDTQEKLNALLIVDEAHKFPPGTQFQMVYTAPDGTVRRKTIPPIQLTATPIEPPSRYRQVARLFHQTLPETTATTNAPRKGELEVQIWKERETQVAALLREKEKEIRELTAIMPFLGTIRGFVNIFNPAADGYTFITDLHKMIETKAIPEGREESATKLLDQLVTYYARERQLPVLRSVAQLLNHPLKGLALLPHTIQEKIADACFNRANWGELQSLLGDLQPYWTACQQWKNRTLPLTSREISRVNKLQQRAQESGELQPFITAIEQNKLRGANIIEQPPSLKRLEEFLRMRADFSAPEAIASLIQERLDSPLEDTATIANLKAEIASLDAEGTRIKEKRTKWAEQNTAAPYDYVSDTLTPLKQTQLPKIQYHPSEGLCQIFEPEKQARELAEAIISHATSPNISLILPFCRFDQKTLETTVTTLNRELNSSVSQPLRFLYHDSFSSGGDRSGKDWVITISPTGSLVYADPTGMKLEDLPGTTIMLYDISDDAGGDFGAASRSSESRKVDAFIFYNYRSPEVPDPFSIATENDLTQEINRVRGEGPTATHVFGPKQGTLPDGTSVSTETREGYLGALKANLTRQQRASSAYRSAADISRKVLKACLLKNDLHHALSLSKELGTTELQRIVAEQLGISLTDVDLLQELYRAIFALTPKDLAPTEPTPSTATDTFSAALEQLQANHILQKLKEKVSNPQLQAAIAFLCDTKTPTKSTILFPTLKGKIALSITDAVLVGKGPFLEAATAADTTSGSARSRESSSDGSTPLSPVHASPSPSDGASEGKASDDSMPLRKGPPPPARRSGGGFGSGGAAAPPQTPQRPSNSTLGKPPPGSSHQR